MNKINKSILEQILPRLEHGVPRLLGQLVEDDVGRGVQGRLEGGEGDWRSEEGRLDEEERGGGGERRRRRREDEKEGG